MSEFTVKYRFYEPAPKPADCTSGGYTPIERLDGPYASVSARWENGYQVVSCDRGDLTPGMTYGPVLTEADQGAAAAANFPRPTLWVMNSRGATIAKYDL